MPKLASILLVDDDATTNFLNTLLINKLEVAEQVLVAGNGEEALRLLPPHVAAAAAPPLVLLDMNMPVMNGLAFLEAYAQLPQASASVVMLLTTSLHQQDLAQAQRLPVAGMLDKPLTKAKLLGILQQYFPQAVPGVALDSSRS